MYAVIFAAEINKLDKSYFDTAKRMRELAINKYGCTKFISVTEENKEISISYWKDKEQIKKWKKDKEHQEAQSIGKSKWYKNYSVQIVEVMHEYHSN
ncbi:MAG: antibiotic biosynthesis monooxygenase [Gammaproteobacteria bacterium]|nr:antibiotic biosynthesis monooxygenase [Gammaproteobacteria bacterium]